MLISHGLHRINTDQAIWINSLLILVAHVDDILIIGCRPDVNALKLKLATTYRFKDLGPVSKYTGINILRDRKNQRLFMDQAPYIRDILDEFDMSNCTPTSLPMDPRAYWEIRDTDRPLRLSCTNVLSAT